MIRRDPPRYYIVTLQADLTGVVEPGRGLGARRMADSDLLDQLQEMAGFPIVPGTLNVRLPGPMERPPTMRYLAAEDIDPGFEAATGQAGFFFAPVLIADRYRGMAMQAVEPGYPDDQVELLCEVHLRQTLGLADGDHVVFSMLGV